MWAASLLELSQSLHVKHVHRLVMGFTETSVESANISGYVQYGIHILPRLVRSCAGLQRLRIDGPPAWHAKEAVKPNVPAWHSFFMSIQLVLGEIRSNRLSLDTCDIRLPRACDFSELVIKSAQTSLSPHKDQLSFMRHLKRLSVTVTDATGRFGKRYFHSDETGAHRQNSHVRHAGDLWNFVQLAGKLTSLRISCKHVLDMDSLPIESLNRLSALQLYRVKLSEQSLVNFLMENVQSLEATDFTEIQLKSGTWRSVLLQICQLPRLIRFFVDSSGYDRAGTSRHLAPRVSPPNDAAKDIESIDTPSDRTALGHLQSHVNDVRRRMDLPLYSDSDYRALRLL